MLEVSKGAKLALINIPGYINWKQFPVNIPGYIEWGGYIIWKTPVVFTGISFRLVPFGGISMYRNTKQKVTTDGKSKLGRSCYSNNNQSPCNLE